MITGEVLHIAGEIGVISALSLPSMVQAQALRFLPSLESLHVEASRAVSPLASASVRHLSLEGTCGCRMSEYPTIGGLLQLRSISLKLVPNMRV